MMNEQLARDLGLLVLRAGSGGIMLIAHGWSKLMRFSDLSDSFSDPLGLGPLPSLVLTIFAEAICSALLVLGLFTRAAALPLLITMLVAAFVVHGDSPFGKKELALMFALSYAAVFALGPGRFSIDARRARRG